MRNLTEWESGYLAGIIDGEGCFRINKCGSERKPGKSYYCPKLTITNNNKSLMEKVQGIIGHLTRGTDPIRLSVGGETLTWLLPQVNLIGKRLHKDLILESLDVKRGGRDPLRLEEIRQKLHALNQRGGRE